MNHLTIEEEKAETKHDDVKVLMKQAEQEYYNTCIDIEVEFSKDEYELIEEYFPDSPIEMLSKELYKVTIHVPAKERLWKALLLSFGSHVKIISPENYKMELIETAQNFLSNYDI